MEPVFAGFFLLKSGLPVPAFIIFPFCLERKDRWGSGRLGGQSWGAIFVAYLSVAAGHGCMLQTEATDVGSGSVFTGCFYCRISST